MLIEPVAEDPLQRRPRRRAGDPRGVDRDRHDAGSLEAERLELLPVEVRIAERQVDPSRQRRELLAAERGEAEEPRIVGREERRRRDVVVLQDLRAGSSRERLGHRRRQREMEDRDVASRRRRVGERQHVAAQVVVDRQREDLRVVPHAAQHLAHGPRAVADRVAAMRRRNPLVDFHRGFGDRGLGDRETTERSARAPVNRRPELAQLLEPLGLVEHRPEVVGDLGRGTRRRWRGPGRRSAAACRRSPLRAAASSAASWLATTRVFEIRVVEHRRHHARDLERILGVVQHAAAVHRRRHRGRGVGQDRTCL